MIIDGVGGVRAELTEDALVLIRKKDTRVLPYSSIEKVVHVPTTLWNLGEISAFLVGDESRASSAAADPNAIEPRNGSKRERAEALLFARELIARVEAATPKVAHPDLNALRSDLKGLRRKEEIGRAYVRKQEAEAAAQAKRDAADPARAAARLQFEQDVARELATAARLAAEGRIEHEHARVQHVLAMAKAFGGRRSVTYAEQQVDLLVARGEIRIGAQLIGTIEPESRIDAVSRRETLGSLLSSKQVPIDVYSDRVAQGASCKPIDAQTRATVILDGEQQTVGRNPFNSRKENTDDRRNARFQVSGSGWGFTVALHPDRLDGPRQLAAQIEIAANRIRAAAPVAVVPHESIGLGPAATESPLAAATEHESLVDQLAKLQSLRDAGTIDAQEFAVLKRSILSAAD